jgi:hypothetical protein
MRHSDGERTYATAQCESCGLILPRYELRQVSVRQRAGESSGATRYIGKTRRSSRVNYRTRYVQRRFLLCPDCKTPRDEGGLLRAFARLVIGGSVIVAAISFVAPAMLGLGLRSHPPANAPVSGNEKSVPSETEAPPALNESPQPDSRTIIRQTDDDLLQDAILAAEQGTPVRAELDGQEAILVPSDAADITGGTCKTVQASGAVSRTYTLCDHGQGWRPR